MGSELLAVKQLVKELLFPAQKFIQVKKTHPQIKKSIAPLSIFRHCHQEKKITFQSDERLIKASETVLQ